ncbi:type VI secretion system membrane subunit TssM [Aidingimonas halophila]|nr:type VI secretion system membrane subunit TssM [Aidingimonas halophila]
MNQAKGMTNRAKGWRRWGMLLGGLLVIVAVVAVWWWGPTWEVAGVRPLAPWSHRLLVTLTLVAVVAVTWGMRLARHLRDLKAEQQHAEQLQQDPSQAEVEQQEANLDAMLNELEANLGGGPRARYRLPWYLVMGVENAGKTSLINRSGQNFALTRVMKASGRGQRGRLGFDWWIGDKAVLIDPDGELLTQGALENGSVVETQRRLWENFVDWLGRHRPRRPLDGVVLVLDLARLSDAQVAVRKAYASLLRARLRELMEQHGARLPVYITFSKMDLLHGFDEFFRHYSRTARRTPMGFTFSPASIDEPAAWEQEFLAGYDAMLERLNRSLPALLAECRDHHEREAVFRFTRQLAGLREVMAEFLSEALSSDRFSTAAMVRGAYFTSVYQQGVPEDPFVDAASRRYGMSGSVHAAHRAARSALYFTEELFDKVIYPEAGLAENNARVLQRRRRLRRASVLACLFVGAAVVGGWSHYYQKNSQALAAVREDAESLDVLAVDELSRDDPTGAGLLEPLDRLRQAMQTFGDSHDHVSWLKDMGLYQGAGVGRQIDDAYMAMLEHQFLPAVMIGIMDDMNRAESGSNEKLALLRLLRMISDASGRQSERVHDVMANRWQQAFPQRGDTQRRLLKHLDYAMAHTNLVGHAAAGDQRAELAMAPFQGSITSAQEELGRQPMAERVYTTLKERSDRRSGAILDLSYEVGPVFTAVFQSDEKSALRIPSLLTQAGFERVFLQQLDQAVDLALIDLWVLGNREDIDFSETDKDRLTSALRERYASDYHATWRQALASIELDDMNSLSRTVELMDTLLGASRPMDRLVDEVAQQTRLYPDLPEDDEAARRALERSPRYQLAREVEKPFRALNALPEDDDDRSSLEDIKSAMADLRDYLEAIQEDNDTGRAAFVAARDRLALQGGAPIDDLERLADDMPAPVDRLLGQLADRSWQLLMKRAISHLETQWIDDVVVPYEETLAGRYPLVASSDRDVALEDFETFFAQDGVLDGFYQDQLQPFVEAAPEELRDDDGESLLDDDVFVAIEQAERIREAYFDRDGALDVEFRLEPVNLSSDKRRSVISVDGQLIEYTHGTRRSVSMVWPNGVRGANESRLTLVPSEVNRSPRSVRRDGAWAWFRLMDEAEIVGASERELDLRFNVDGGSMRYRLRADGSRNPFTRQLVGDFHLPTALYAEGDSDADDA